MRSDARDDAGTVQSLMALARYLAPVSPAAREALKRLEELAEAASEGPLRPWLRGELSGFVHALEQALA